MRYIDVNQVRELVRDTVIDISNNLSPDVLQAMKEARSREAWPIASSTLDLIIENAHIATKNQSPICQDTGMVVVFLTIGQDVHFTNGFIEEAINQGVCEGFTQGYLRKSVVEDPLYHRINTEDNAPAVIYYQIAEGDQVIIEITTKGFGSENMSRLKMLKPSDGVQGVRDFVLETVELAGANACPPFIVGVGIGGTMDKAAWLAKKALLRDLNKPHGKEDYKVLEEELLEEINNTGIGPQGYGGKTTCLRVLIKSYPTHIAGLPVAVNINCHATRHKRIVL